MKTYIIETTDAIGYYGQKIKAEKFYIDNQIAMFLIGQDIVHTVPANMYIIRTGDDKAK